MQFVAFVLFIFISSFFKRLKMDHIGTAHWDRGEYGSQNNQIRIFFVVSGFSACLCGVSFFRLCCRLLKKRNPVLTFHAWLWIMNVGTFKYVLIQIRDKEGNQKLVSGDSLNSEFCVTCNFNTFCITFIEPKTSLKPVAVGD